MLFQDIRFGVRTALKNKGVTGLAVDLPGDRHRAEHDDVQRHRRRADPAAALPRPRPPRRPPHRRRSRTTSGSATCRGSSCRTGRSARAPSARSPACSTAASPSATAAMPIATPARRVSHELFPLLGMSPQLGRDFTADDDRARRRTGRPASPTISGSAATTRIPSIVGRAIQVNSRPHTVIGVMPPRFRFPENQYLWLPLVRVRRQPAARRSAASRCSRA